MCGILAVIDVRGRDIVVDTVRRLRDTMVHRGPDDEGVWLDGPVALAHRRLSIIDLSPAGRQPMSNDDGSIQLVFNGEIYNYVEERADLSSRGHAFRTSSDTEVIIRAYEEEGERCVDRLRGMFAFALWDRRRRRLFAARDRVGIKPLYYFQDDTTLVLASEVKAILEHPSVPRRPDPRGLADYLFAGRALAGKTSFEAIRELEPGYVLTFDIDTRHLDVRRYWDIRYEYDFSRSDEQVEDEVFAVLDDALRVQCRSDAAVGAHLSGGVDSSTVVSLAARHRPALKTFSIRFSDDPYVDDIRKAVAVATHVGAEYVEGNPTPDHLADLLPRVIWHMDAPMIGDGGFGYLAVATLASAHVKVALTGHGGDEVFAGYPAQFEAAFGTTSMFDLVQDPDRVSRPNRLLERILRKGPAGIVRALRNRVPGRQRRESLEDLWVALHCDDWTLRTQTLHPDLLAQLKGYSPRDEFVAPLRAEVTDQALDRCLYHDLKVYLPSLLHMEDRMSMAASIESRVPLLDDRVIAYLATVPPSQKTKGLQPKHLLRQTAADLLPAEVVQSRAKRGFPIPGSFWRSQRVNETVREILLSKESLSRGLFTPAALRQSCDDVTQCWPLLNVELWFRVFVDRDPSWLARAKDASEAVIRS